MVLTVLLVVALHITPVLTLQGLQFMAIKVMTVGPCTGPAAQMELAAVEVEELIVR
jgi:hypothetical protein